MEISIRTASYPDIPIIRTLAEQTWWPTYSPFLDRQQIDFMLSTIYSSEAMKQAMADGQTFLLAENNSAPVGFASFSPWGEEPLVVKVNKLYVLPSAHRGGVGRKLLNEIERRCRINGVNKLVLNVNRQNPAMGFYRHNGFDILREEDVAIGPYWMNDFVLVREIKN